MYISELYVPNIVLTSTPSDCWYSGRRWAALQRLPRERLRQPEHRRLRRGGGGDHRVRDGNSHPLRLPSAGDHGQVDAEGWRRRELFVLWSSNEDWSLNKGNLSPLCPVNSSLLPLDLTTILYSQARHCQTESIPNSCPCHCVFTVYHFSNWRVSNLLSRFK